MLEALGNLGDFVGGIAVVITLLYLAVQVRQNTRAMKTASRQEIVSGFRDCNRLTFQPGAWVALLAGARRYPDLPFDQKGLFHGFITDLALFFQGAFALYEAGTLEDETYRAYLHFFAAVVTTPGCSTWWAEFSGLYPSGMVAEVNTRIAEGDLFDLLQLDPYAEAPAA